MVIEVDNKKTVLLFLLVIIVFVAGFFVVNNFSKKGIVVREEVEETPNEIKVESEQVKSSCGNDVCEQHEWCNKCPEDCGCQEGYYCNELNGVCYREEICGDGRCTDKERIIKNCCLDCGCSEGQLCSIYLGECINKVVISNEVQKNILKKYKYYDLISIGDGYYEELAIKKYAFNCTRAGTPYGCVLIAFVSENGSVLYEDLIDI